MIQMNNNTNNQKKKPIIRITKGIAGNHSNITNQSNELGHSDSIKKIKITCAKPVENQLNRLVASSSSALNTNLDLALDLDAIFGFISSDSLIGNFSCTIKINLENNKESNMHEKIKSDIFYEFKDASPKKIKSLEHIRFGSFESNLGFFDVFLVLEDSSISRIYTSSLKCLIFEILKDLSSSESNVKFFSKSYISITDGNDQKSFHKSLTGWLLSSDFKLFFDILKQRLNQNQIYVFFESYGNKRLLTTEHKKTSDILS